MPDPQFFVAGRRVSLVIPIRDEEASLAALIASIRCQTRSPDEVLLVDGGSNDRTVALARELIGDDARFRVVEAGDATPGRGRNVGTAAAKWEWIAYTDAGIRLEPTWLERMEEVALRDPAVMVVYGNFEPLVRTRFEEWASLAYVPPKRDRPGGRMRGPSIVSSLLRRSAWEAIGGFPDLRAAEDLLFMDKVRVAEFSTGWAPTATVWWELRPTLGSTFRKFVLYSAVNVRAGQQRHWHYGIARKYLLASPFLALAVVHHRWWLALPLAGWIGRVVKGLWDRREAHGLAWIFHPARFLGVGVILLTIDLATFAGWMRARWAARPSRPSFDGHSPTTLAAQRR